MKDIFLLKSTLKADRNIVSLDENTAHKCFTHYAQTIPKLQEIAQINPDAIQNKHHKLDMIYQGESLLIYQLNSCL